MATFWATFGKRLATFVSTFLAALITEPDKVLVGELNEWVADPLGTGQTSALQMKTRSAKSFKVKIEDYSTPPKQQFGLRLIKFVKTICPRRGLNSALMDCKSLCYQLSCPCLVVVIK